MRKKAKANRSKMYKAKRIETVQVMHPLIFKSLSGDQRSEQLEEMKDLPVALKKSNTFLKAVLKNLLFLLKKEQYSTRQFNRTFQLAKRITEMLQELGRTKEVSKLLFAMFHHLWVNTELRKLDRNGFENYITLLRLTEAGKCGGKEWHSSKHEMEKYNLGASYASYRIRLICVLIEKYGRDNLDINDQSRKWSTQQTETFKQYIEKEIEHQCVECSNHQASLLKGFFLHWYWFCRLYKDYDYTRNLLGGIRLLIELGIDPNAQDATGNTLLHHICSNKYFYVYSCCDKYWRRIVRWILTCLKHPRAGDIIDLELSENWSNKVLSLTRLLVKQVKCSLDIKNNDGLTASDLSQKFIHSSKTKHRKLQELVQL